MSEIRMFRDPKTDEPVYPVTTERAVYGDDERSLPVHLGEKINYTDALSLEEIAASTSLDNKVPSADAIKDINRRITGNTYTNRIDLKLVQEEWYICPSDGYLFVGNNSYAPVVVSFNNTYQSLTVPAKQADAVAMYENVFLKKGMSVRTTNKNSLSNFYFCPLY